MSEIKEKNISGLCVRVCTGGGVDDVVVIYAEPHFTDLQALLPHNYIQNVLSEILWKSAVKLKGDFDNQDSEEPQIPEIEDDFIELEDNRNNHESLDLNENNWERIKDSEKDNFDDKLKPCGKASGEDDRLRGSTSGDNERLCEKTSGDCGNDSGDNERLCEKTSGDCGNDSGDYERLVEKTSGDSERMLEKASGDDEMLIEKTSVGKARLRDELDEILDVTVKMEQDHEMLETVSGTTSYLMVMKDYEKLEEDRYLCSICKEIIPRDDITNHKLVHLNVLECDVCNKSFKRTAQLKHHKEKGCVNGTIYSCAECSEELDSKSSLKHHMKNIHSKLKYKCKHCDHVAQSLGNLKVHEKIHQNIKCQSCRKLFKSAEEKSEHECLKPDRFQCDQCEKSYLVKAELKKHINISHEGQRFPCTVCSDILSSSQALKRHIKNVHELKVKNFKCQFCEKSFKDKQTLQKHEKIHDESTKSDPCPECGKILSSNEVLKIHIKRVHERNFKHTCEECGKGYPYLHALQIHAEMSHLKGAVFVCTICGQDYVGKHRLRNHMLQKHPKGQEFSNCNHCGKEVPVTQMRSHVVDAHKMQAYKFQCTFCPKRFDTKAHIREHIRKHTGARPFLCRGCGKHFFCRETAKKHIRLFHGEDLSLVHYDLSKDVDNPYVN